MAKSIGTGLARVTVAAPKRRIDVALPEHVPLSELLPSLLRHAGDDLGDKGQQHGGWLLRRTDGVALDANRTLGAQQLRDGEVLYLVPRRAEWPELDYDDVVDVIAEGATRAGQAWSWSSTRTFGVSLGCATLLGGLLICLISGPPWLIILLPVAILGLALLGTGVLLSRAAGDSATGGTIAAVGVVYAAAAGAMVVGGELRFVQFGPAQLLVAGAVLLLAGILADLGVADRSPLLITTVTIGVLTELGALLAILGLSPSASAAVVSGVAMVFLPTLPLMSLRLAAVTMPTLPAAPEDIAKDDEPIPRPQVYRKVVRADQLLSGMLIGLGVVTSICLVVMVGSGQVQAMVLVALMVLIAFLRARVFMTVRQRGSLLAIGTVGVFALALPMILVQPLWLRLAIVFAGMIAVTVAAVTSGLVYSRKPPTPFMVRYADIVEIVCVVALVPMICWVGGLFEFVRGLYG